MPKWEEVSQDAFRAAGELWRTGRFRSNASRAYYAAFSALTLKLRGKAPFPPQFETPHHRDVPSLIGRFLTEYYPKGRRELQTAVRRLYKARLDADYKVSVDTSKEIGLRSLRDAAFVLKSCGVEL